MTPARTNIDHEVTAVEEGHRAFVNDDGSIRVVSDTRPEAYRIDYWAMPSGLIRFCCDHNIVRGFGVSPVTKDPGHLGCKHAALAARRLEREGLAAFHPSGVWVSLLRAA